MPFGDDATGPTTGGFFKGPAISFTIVNSGSNRSAVSNFEFELLGFNWNLFFGAWYFRFFNYGDSEISMSDLIE